MNLSDEEIVKLESAKTDVEWDGIVDEIKEKRNGNYPPDWGEKIIFGLSNPDIDLDIHISQVLL